MVKPVRSLLLLFYVGCLLSVIAVFSPGELPLTDSFSLNLFTPEDLNSIAGAERQTPTDISEIIALQNRLDSISRISEAAKAGDTVKRTGKTAFATAEDKGFVLPKYEVKDVRVPLVYAKKESHPLDYFFRGLQNIRKQESPIRLVHYGDSQLEGDRITSYLRQKFQRLYGGSGVGLVPLREKQAMRSTLLTNSSPSIRIQSILDRPARHKGRRYGLLGSVFTFESDSGSAQKTKVDVTFRRSKYTGKNDRHTKISRLNFLYSARNKVNLSFRARPVGASKDTVWQAELPASEGFNSQKISAETEFKKLNISIQTNGKAEFYGIGLDGKTGLAADNVALRGSSVMDFAKSNREFLRRQYQEMNVRLMVLQFGVNVVPNPQKSYGFYEQMFHKQLKYLRSVMPEMSILVVGVSDMARKQGTGYASYPNITMIRNAQKKAAFRAGCAYWDLYDAMGGQNSMISWVRSKPSLAAKDYTHFNGRGARLVGEMLFDAIIKEYDRFSSTEK